MKWGRRCALIVVAGLVACSASQYWKPYRPVRPRVTATADSLYRASLEALVGQGYTVQTTDRRTGLLVTQWDHPDDSNAFRFRLQVHTGDNRLEVDIGVQRRERPDLWVDASGEEGQRPRYMLERADRLVAAIVGAAERR